MKLATRKIQLKNREKPSTVSVPPNAVISGMPCDIRNLCWCHNPRPANARPSTTKNSRYFRCFGDGKIRKSNRKTAHPNSASMIAGTSTKWSCEV